MLMCGWLGFETTDDFLNALEFTNIITSRLEQGPEPKRYRDPTWTRHKRIYEKDPYVP